MERVRSGKIGNMKYSVKKVGPNTYAGDATTARGNRTKTTVHNPKRGGGTSKHDIEFKSGKTPSGASYLAQRGKTTQGVHVKKTEITNALGTTSKSKTTIKDASGTSKIRSQRR